jgi:hypothetical protein
LLYMNLAFNACYTITNARIAAVVLFTLLKFDRAAARQRAAKIRIVYEQRAAHTPLSSDAEDKMLEHHSTYRPLFLPGKEIYQKFKRNVVMKRTGLVSSSFSPLFISL